MIYCFFGIFHNVAKLVYNLKEMTSFFLKMIPSTRDNLPIIRLFSKDVISTKCKKKINCKPVNEKCRILKYFNLQIVIDKNKSFNENIKSHININNNSIIIY